MKLHLALLALLQTLVPAERSKGQADAQSSGRPTLIRARKIWDRAPHNAFTDLVRFHDHWFCVFREGRGHVSPDGTIRVLTSLDGQDWTAAALLTQPKADLR